MTQLRLYNENKEAFVATMGQEAFNAKIMELLNKLPDPSSIRMSIDGDADDEQEDRDNNN